jgi:hypothetical protein
VLQMLQNSLRLIISMLQQVCCCDIYHMVYLISTGSIDPKILDITNSFPVERDIKSISCRGMVNLCWTHFTNISLLFVLPLFLLTRTIMNTFHLARILTKRSQTMISSRFFSKGGAIPTSSTVEIGGVKVIGLPHLSVRRHNVQANSHA